jgi:hypothetical protein
MTDADDIRIAKEQVQSDIVDTFTGVLQPQEGRTFEYGLHDSTLEDDIAVATSAQLIAVPWRFPCTHVGKFLDIPATNVDFELHGTTIVDIRGVWLYHRYIDWLGALHQIGVTTATRPAHAEIVEIIDVEERA